MIAQFGNKRFSVSSDKIYTFNGLSYSSTLSTDEQDAAGKKPATVIKNAGLNTLKMTVMLSVDFGINPRAEIMDWERLKDAATPYPFLLGSSQWGKNKYLLKDCNAGKMEINRDGKLLSAELQLAFTEYLPPGKQTSTAGANATRGIAITNAYAVKAPTEKEKSQMKRINLGMQG